VTRLTNQLWDRYRNDGDPTARRQLLDGYLGLVHHAARAIAQRGVTDVELDELISAGTIGLVQALEGFDPGRGLAFSTYAVPRIRGAMLDELRQRDWMPRSMRSRSRQIAAARSALQQRLGRMPAAPELAEELKVDLGTLWKWEADTGPRVLLAIDQPSDHGGEETTLAETIPDMSLPEPEAAMTHDQHLQRLREAFQSLPEKERLVLMLSFYEGINLREIGEVLHVTESRVSQIRTRALARLRERCGFTPEDL